MKEFDIFLPIEVAARLEGISTKTIQKRIERKRYPEWSIRRISRPVGGYKNEIHLTVLSETAKALYLQDHQSEVSEELPEIKKERKKRSDAGKTKADEGLLFRAAAIITTAKASSTGRINSDRYFGFDEGYKFFCDASKENNSQIVSYRQFINLVKDLVDREAQSKINLGSDRYNNQKQMVLRHDYSPYEPMQFLQNDHTQFDCICLHDGKILRPWASFHNSVGDRILSYPTIVERPDSYSLADNLSNFVLRYGLSQRPVIYKSDNGKAQKSRIMTKDGSWDDVELNSFDIDARHEYAMNLMGIGSSQDKGLVQNLGMIETHSIARQPRTKLIERQFGIGGTMEWFKDRPEYTGRKYEEKPEQFEKIKKSMNIWSSEEMVEYVMNKIDQYNNRIHQGIKDECKGMFAVPHTYNLNVNYFQESELYLRLVKGSIPDSMQDVYRTFNDPLFAKEELKTEIYSPMWRRKIYEICGWMSRALPSRESLAVMSMGMIERTVHTWGIDIDGNSYISFKLKPYVTKKVIVRYSPDNIIRIREQSGKEKIFISEIYVFEKAASNKDEKFICIAEPHPRTVSGIAPEGYAKTFLSERTIQNREISKAARITSEIAQGKVEESVQQTNIVQLNSFRDMAAQQLSQERKAKKVQEKLKEKEDEELEDELSQIYGTKIKVSE